MKKIFKRRPNFLPSNKNSSYDSVQIFLKRTVASSLLITTTRKCTILNEKILDSLSQEVIRMKNYFKMQISTEMPTSTDYPQSLWKITKNFSFLRTTETYNFSTGFFKKRSNQKCCQKSAKLENMIPDGVEFPRSIVF